MNASTRFFSPRTALVAVALAIALLPPGASFGPASDAKSTEAEALSASFRKAARRVLPAVVTVRAVGAPPRVFRPPQDVLPFPVPEFPQPGEAGGSGVVIDAEKGYVLTNDHVVNSSSRVVVILHDGRERPVSQIRRDPKSDLALLIIDPKGLTATEWGDSDAIDTGDWVLAVGQPFGLSGTVTAGIVSGKGRGFGMTMYEDLIQTDAAINPGNSGGPLVNLKGQVIGVSTALKTMRGSFEGVGFAVPASRAKRVASDLARHGSVRRAYLGVAIGPVDPATAEKIEQPGAVVVNGITEGSPADKAGLRRGDILVKLQGQPLQGLGALQGAIEFATVGEPLTLTVNREGATRDVEVRPESQPEQFGLPRTDQEQPLPLRGEGGEPELAPPRVEVPARGDQTFPDLGLRLGEPTEFLARRFRLRVPAHGLVVVGVEPGGPADRGGIEIGMVITDAANRRVESLADFRDALANRPKDRDLLLRILRGFKAEFRVILDRTEGRPAAGDEEKTKGRGVDAPLPKPVPEGVRDR
jgi:serine protease Do